MDIKLQPRKVVKFLIVLSVAFTLAHIAEQLAESTLGRTFGLYLFDLEQEQSLPRFFSAVMLLLCSVLIFTIAASEKREPRRRYLHWIGLALIFLLLAITKVTVIHEKLGLLIRAALKITETQFDAWAYSILVILLMVLYLGFLLSLPRRIIALLVVGGIIFVLGAFGLDLIGASFDTQTISYKILAILEEILEMAGTIIFVYTFLVYLSTERHGVRLVIEKP
jgi:hypothetical protein